MRTDTPGEVGSIYAASAGLGREKSRTAWWMLSVALFLALACFRFPHLSLTTGLDPSWNAVLVYAHEQGLQFGKEIAFTYGPLGFLSIECFSPHTAFVRILFEVLLGGGVAAGLCL